MFYHGGELPGFNSFMGYGPQAVAGRPDTAQAMLAPLLDHIHAELSLG